MGAHADVADDAPLFLPLYIGQKLPFHHLAELLLAVHKVNHAQVDVVRLQPGEQILEGLLHLGHLPGADILPLLPGGAKMPLDNPLLPVALDGVANFGAHLWVGHPAVQDVDAIAFAPLDDGRDLFLVVALQPLGAQAYLTDLQAGAAQFPITHGYSSLRVPIPGDISKVYHLARPIPRDTANVNLS